MYREHGEGPKTRCVSRREDTLGPEDREPRRDKPEEFEGIHITAGYDFKEKKPDQGLTVALTKNQFKARIVTLQNKSKTPAQLLFYNSGEVQEVQKLNEQAQGERLAGETPPGITWVNKQKKYLLAPIAWTDALTEYVSLSKGKRGEVILTTTNKDRQQETVVLYQGEVYPQEAWGKADQAAQLAEEQLNIPLGSPASSKWEEPEPITWEDKEVDPESFRPNGMYGGSSQTGSIGIRYGFMGWTRPKK